MAIPARVAERLAAGVKRFQPILSSAKARDVNESDTSMIVTDVLAEIFGYDKYSEVTRELCIRGTFCDLATRIDGKFQMLIEVKAIGLELKEGHVKQAVDYAANQGIEWVALTNGNF
jgi:predicted type IV restriction endonuclease